MNVVLIDVSFFDLAIFIFCENKNLNFNHLPTVSLPLT